MSQSTPSRTNKVGRSPFSPIAMQAEESNYEASQLEKTSTDEMMALMGSMKISDPNEDLDSVQETIDWEKETKEMDRMFNHQSKEMIAKLPRYVQPIGLKNGTKLLDHQKDGVRWLLSQELNPNKNPFYSEQKSVNGNVYYMDRFDRFKIDAPYPPVKGAVLADGTSAIFYLTCSILNPPLTPHCCFYFFAQRWGSARRCRL
ncbi:MAG: hypothetical protein SGARI_008359 [Bacillariaceae sp.]